MELRQIIQKSRCVMEAVVAFYQVSSRVVEEHTDLPRKAQNCEDKFIEVASSPRFNFIGNIELGTSLPLTSIKPHYDAILFAYGASKDRELGIPGEHARQIHSARAFVGWYNGLPEYKDLAPNLQAGEDAVIIGQGNVALDVARTLLTNIDVLRKTDMTEYALAELVRSKIKRVRVVGRRGPAQVRPEPPICPSTTCPNSLSLQRPHSQSKKSANFSNYPPSPSNPSLLIYSHPTYPASPAPKDA